ncbi:MAG: sodium/glutamate symporter [Cyanobacteria bacterium K_Offshore_surface_m2_239]|nr:sodium/glutamate symporter [Cyanobacteria bacterium K_Offshore_surface_m2_239]
MNPVDGQIQVASALTFTLGILVLFLGKSLNRHVRLLRDFTIPEPVSGGLFVALVIAVLHGVFGLDFNFGMRARDLLLVYFFTTVGINASFADLRRGGRSLLVLLALTILLMLAQNSLGLALARAIGLPPAAGLLAGTVSLIGGHGTTIAWAPRFAAEAGVTNAMELGIAAATFGLILASATGGPVAQFLIRRHRLAAKAPQAPGRPASVQPAPSDDRGTPAPGERVPTMCADDVLGAVLAINICIILGSILQELIRDRGLFLPLFVPCLIVGILLSNLLPQRIGGVRLRWPSRTPAIDLIAEISLGAFLAMSLMTIKFWTLVDLAGPLLVILIAQFSLALLLNLFLVFPLLGGGYDAAVMAAGFMGFTLGSTPTAMANMTAVTQTFGPSPKAFIVLPLVSAFFIDLLNAMMIPYFLHQLG